MAPWDEVSRLHAALVFPARGHLLGRIPLDMTWPGLAAAQWGVPHFLEVSVRNGSLLGLVAIGQGFQQPLLDPAGSQDSRLPWRDF